MVLALLVSCEAQRSAYAQTQGQNKTGSPQDVLSLGFGQATPDYEHSCGRSKNDSDTNLCISRESLKAYKKQAFWAEGTAIVGAIGTAAILVTLIWTVKSVRAAERSAAAALKQVEVSAGQMNIAKGQLSHLQALEQPFIFPVINADFQGFMYRLRKTNENEWPDRLTFPQLHVELRLHNYGKSPAIITDVFVSEFVGAEFPKMVPLPGTGLPKELVVAPGARTGNLTDQRTMRKLIYMTYDDFCLMLRGESFIWIRGAVDYADIFGTRWRYVFCWRYSFAMQKFAPHPWSANYAEKNNDLPDA